MKKIIVLFLLLMLLLTGCQGSGTFNEVFDSNWGITMPSNLTEVYELESKAAFNGDGIRYHVFSYENEEDISNWLEFSEEQSATVFSYDYEHAIDNWFIELGRDVKEPINYEGSVYYYQAQDDNSELIIVLNKVEQKIYIMESFM